MLPQIVDFFSKLADYLNIKFSDSALLYKRNLKTLSAAGMSSDYNHINLEELIEIYRREACELRDALLNGATWNELKEKSATVTRLSIAIHLKNPKFFKNCNPAEFPLDRSSGSEP